eukprot:GHVR01009398.1.p1 GENE.GHVR01009398.1~~GHVR01009398.1.p1  ORF type:complete len:109 (-),score=14.88 GHVR01009398.1:131-457(-)
MYLFIFIPRLSYIFRNLYYIGTFRDRGCPPWHRERHAHAARGRPATGDPAGQANNDNNDNKDLSNNNNDSTSTSTSTNNYIRTNTSTNNTNYNTNTNTNTDEWAARRW